MYRVLGDPSKPRSWSKYANDSSLKNKNEARNVKSQEKPIDSTKSDNAKDTEKRDGKKQRTREKENEQVKQALEKVR